MTFILLPLCFLYYFDMGPSKADIAAHFHQTSQRSRAFAVVLMDLGRIDGQERPL